MAGCFLDVSKRDAGVERGGDEGVAEGVWPYWLVDAGLAGQPAYDPPGGVAVESFAIVSPKDRPLDPFSDGEIDGAGGSGSEWDGDDLAALAQHRERAVASFEAEGFDVGAERFGDTQAVDRQQ